jgi:hypothetical protein
MKYSFQSTTNVNDHNHCKRLTEAFQLFLFVKSAFRIASENLVIMSCFSTQSKGYSVHKASVILKYHIRPFFQFSVRGEYCHGHLGNEANTAD